MASNATRTGNAGADNTGNAINGLTPGERAFQSRLPDLLAWAGGYVVVLGDRVVGVFHDEATAWGVAAHATDPTLDVLVRRIEPPANEAAPRRRNQA